MEIDQEQEELNKNQKEITKYNAYAWLGIGLGAFSVIFYSTIPGMASGIAAIVFSIIANKGVKRYKMEQKWRVTVAFLLGLVGFLYGLVNYIGSVIK
ncbi:MAG: hypothetical protein WCT08_01360 [Patescibacteria group bacterium]|jgi:hypothetical protein